MTVCTQIYIYIHMLYVPIFLLDIASFFLMQCPLVLDSFSVSTERTITNTANNARSAKSVEMSDDSLNTLLIYLSIYL